MSRFPCSKIVGDSDTRPTIVLPLSYLVDFQDKTLGPSNEVIAIHEVLLHARLDSAQLKYEHMIDTMEN